MALSRKQRVFGGILIVIIIAAVGAGAWWLVTQRQTQTAQDKALTQLTGRDSAAWGQRTTAAQNFLAKHDTNGGLAYYRQLIQRAGNQDDKLSLLLEAAQFAVSSKQYDAALGFVDQADAIRKTTGAAVERAMIYEAKGDKTAAIAQYRAAITLAQSDKNGLSGRYVDQWQAKITELSQ